MSHESYFPTDVLDAIACGIVVLDNRERVLAWNRWMERHSNIPADRAMGQPLGALFPEIRGKRLDEAIRSALKHGLAGLLSPSMHLPPLPLHVDCSQQATHPRMQQIINITPLHMAGAAACTLQIQDVTTSVQRERKLREQTVALHKKNLELRARIDDIHSLQDQITEMSTHDALTGTLNREAIDTALLKALAEAQAAQHTLSVVLFDIDLLRHINETWGTTAGDEVLRTLGVQLAEMLPPQSIAGRYGTDEFLVLLPGMDVDTAWQLAENCRNRFNEQRIHTDSTPLQVTLSAGVAAFPMDSLDVGSLIECVSLALFLAKHDGYNRTVRYDAGQNEVF
jgi:diguanylate cyclase (GGDEF)-like protein